MKNYVLMLLGGSLSLGIAAQWLAWRLRLPSILLLLMAGILAGPIFGILHPGELMGSVLQPMVSLFVAIILFEGGLSLQISELASIGPVVMRLITIGALTTWLVISNAAHYLGNLEWRVALLLGAVLVVTGPTVIGPLLALVRPTERVGSILKWEGILIDPIGAILALLVYEGVVASQQTTPAGIATDFAWCLLVGVASGGVAAAILYQVMRRQAVPEFLQSPVALMFVLLSFIVAQQLHGEAGLVAVTTMGVALANQTGVNMRGIIEFKENLRVLLLAWLFIMLAARLDLVDIAQNVRANLAVFAVVVLVARPLAVLLSTLGTQTTRAERIFLACVAPRGIVAAAVASAFGLELTAAGVPQADRIVALAFLVIIGTVVVYGLGAEFVARRLGLKQPEPQGVLILGAHDWARDLGLALQNAGVKVFMVDSNHRKVASARLLGLNARPGNVLSEAVREEMGPDIGRLLAITGNDDVNRLATLHFAEIFGRHEVYQLPPSSAGRRHDAHAPQHLRGRFAFSDSVSFIEFERRFNEGERLHVTALTPEFDFAAFRHKHGDAALPLFAVSSEGLQIFTDEGLVAPRPGSTLISLRRDGEAPHAVGAAQPSP